MATTANSTPITSGMPKVVDGYDLEAERARYRLIPDVVVRGQRLNRGTATVALTGSLETPALAAVRARHNEVIFPNTLAADSPVVELGWPLSGSFVRCSAGVYLDLYLAVAQKVLDPAHPRIRAALQPLIDMGMLTQREINTDDFLVSAEGCEGLHTPQELAALAGSAMAASFPGTGAWKAFLSNSGTEAVEAGVKLAWQVRHKRFLEEHGFPKLERVAKDLGIGRFPGLDHDRSLPDPLLADYPFYMVGCRSAFHGRTLGALQFTSSKKAQRAGYPMTRRVLQVPYNGSPADLSALIDPRPIDAILAAPGGVKAVIDAGRIPRDLFAGFLADPFQGEGGYLPGDPAWWRGIAAVVREHGGLLCADEVQSFGRTGTLFFSEQLGVQPDVLCTAKGMVVGLTLARAGLSKHLHTGWHSNTWGGGKIFDNQWSYAVLDTLLHHRDPVLGGLPYVENCRVKGSYLDEGFRRLAERHPALVKGHDVRGLLAGLSVRRRADVIRVGWKRGVKLLGCGPSGEVSRIRILFLADAVVRELDEALRVLDEVLAEVGAAPAA
jgi:4-aminobutyrate aminotransferase-like enzyme